MEMHPMATLIETSALESSHHMAALQCVHRSGASVNAHIKHQKGGDVISVTGQWFLVPDRLVWAFQNLDSWRLGKVRVTFFQFSAVQFRWACCNLSLLLLAVLELVFCFCSPSASRFNASYFMRCFSAHHCYKEWLSYHNLPISLDQSDRSPLTI